MFLQNTATCQSEAMLDRKSLLIDIYFNMDFT